VRRERETPADLDGAGTAGLCALSLTFSITQRDASRRSRSAVNWSGGVVGEVPVDAVGERRGRGGKISPDRRGPYAARECVGSVESG
jgi:hypothetical protein